MEELILENRAVNITDRSTALELSIGTVRATAHEEPGCKSKTVTLTERGTFGCQVGTIASLYSEIMLKINYTLWDK